MSSWQKFAAFAVALGAVDLSVAQSLGDVARQERIQKKPSSGARHVLTEDDMPATSSSSSSSSSSKASDQPKAKPEDAAEKKEGDAEDRQISASEIKAAIKQKKNKIAAMNDRIDTLQRRLDAWKTSDCTKVQYIDSNDNPCDEPPKIRTALGLARSQLEKEQTALEAMQDEARRLGYGNSVYDPD